MKIITIVKTRNEERNIGKFCAAYTWADKVLVADGGSEDDTVSIASAFANVEVREFTERAYAPDGIHWENVKWKHTDFLIDWAEDEGADWIVFDDCDCRPNKELKEQALYLFLLMDSNWGNFLCVNRVYIKGTSHYYKMLSMPDGTFTPSLWAWRANKGFRSKPDTPHVLTFNKEITCNDSLHPPYCLLHYFAPDEETVQKKLSHYRNVRPEFDWKHPNEFGGAFLPLEEWMVE